MFSISLKGNAPIYEQLCGRITELISTGAIPKEEKLPAVREVAKELGVNPNTVQKAYQLLEQQGLIYSVPAKGSYVNPLDDGVVSLRMRAMEGFGDSVKFAINCGIEKAALVETINAN